MNNKNKIWESKKKLLEKLKNERTRYVKKHNSYMVSIKEGSVRDFAEDGKLTVIKSIKPSESPWISYIKEYDKRISNFQNSNSFRYCKKIAKGRKGGK